MSMDRFMAIYTGARSHQFRRAVWLAGAFGLAMGFLLGIATVMALVAFT